MDKLPDISHYLKSPLVSLGARVYLLKNKLSSDDSSSIGSKISELVFRIELFEDYLVLNNGEQLNIEKANINSLINKIIAEWNGNNEVKVECENSSDGLVYIDEMRISRVINCLLRQVIKCHDVEEVCIRITKSKNRLRLSFGEELLKDADSKYIEVEYCLLVLDKLGGYLDEDGSVIIKIK